MYRTLTILLFQIVLCWHAYGQEIKPLDNGWFAIDRAYAELIASRFDSLNACNNELMLTDDALAICMEVKRNMQIELRLEVMRADASENALKDSQKMIQSFENEIKLQKIQIKKIKSQKIWGCILAGVGGLATGIVTGIIIAK